ASCAHSNPSRSVASACFTAWQRMIRKARRGWRHSCRGCGSRAGPLGEIGQSIPAGAEPMRRYAEELVALAPDAILATGSATVGPLLQVTHMVPIVFAYVPDPVGAGFVDSLARPGGNATGFTPFEYSIGGKWLELLKQMAPDVVRAAVLRDPAISAGIGQFGAIQASAPSAGLEVTPINVRESLEIERSLDAFARTGKGGLIVTASALAVNHRALIINLATQHKLPAVYFQ